MGKIALLTALLLIVLGAIPVLAQTEIKLGNDPNPLGAGYGPPLPGTAGSYTLQEQKPYDPNPLGAGYGPPLPGTLAGALGESSKEAMVKCPKCGQAFTQDERLAQVQMYGPSTR